MSNIHTIPYHTTPCRLYLDRFFMQMIELTTADDVDVELNPDATWKVNKEEPAAAEPTPSAPAPDFVIDDDDDDAIHAFDDDDDEGTKAGQAQTSAQ